MRRNRTIPPFRRSHRKVARRSDMTEKAYILFVGMVCQSVRNAVLNMKNLTISKMREYSKFTYDVYNIKT